MQNTLKIRNQKPIKRKYCNAKTTGSAISWLNTSKKPNKPALKDASQISTKPRREQPKYLCSRFNGPSCTSLSFIRNLKRHLPSWPHNYGITSNRMALNCHFTLRPSSVKSLQNHICIRKQESTSDINRNANWNTRSNHNLPTAVTWIVSHFERNTKCHDHD